MANDGILPAWRRIEATAETSGCVPGEVLLRERGWKTEEEFQREYSAEFASGERTVFAEKWLEEAFTGEFPVFDEVSRVDLQFDRHPPVYYLNGDVGKVRNHAALTLLEYRTLYTGRRDPVTWQYRAISPGQRVPSFGSTGGAVMPASALSGPGAVRAGRHGRGTAN